MILQAVNKKEVPLEEVQEMIDSVDKDGGGEIELPEFLDLMAEQMQQQEQDEELIAAFKLFGAKSAEDVISYDTLEESLRELATLDEFKDDELRIIFDEIAGASQRTTAEDDESLNGSPGISLTDFMLMMMAK